MALPTSNIQSILSLHDQGQYGPFLSGGAIYVIAPPSVATSDVMVHKSTDPDASGFSEQDSGNRHSSGGAVQAVSAFQFGTDLHIASQDDNGDIDYSVFHMATDLWDTTIGTESVTTTPGNLQQIEKLLIGVRAGPDVLVMYSGESDNVMGRKARCDYARRESGSWTADIALDNGGEDEWIPGVIVMGSSDRTHFFFSNVALNAYQRTLTSGNSLESFPSAFHTNVDAFGDDTDNKFGNGTSYDDGGTERVRCVVSDDTVGDLSVELDSADSPTVSTGGTVNDATNVHPDLIRMSANGTDLHAMLVFGDILRDLNEDDGGWGTDIFVQTVSILDGLLGMTYIASSISTVNSGEEVLAYLYRVNTNPYFYNEVLLNPPDTALQDPIHGPGIIPFLR